MFQYSHILRLSNENLGFKSTSFNILRTFLQEISAYSLPLFCKEIFPLELVRRTYDNV